MTNPKIDELKLFRGKRGKITYNSICTHCAEPCKQSYKAEIHFCPDFQDYREITVGTVAPQPPTIAE